MKYILKQNFQLIFQAIKKKKDEIEEKSYITLCYMIRTPCRHPQNS